jgi:DNA transformation protein
MSVSEADIAFAKELFSDLPNLTSRKMMGGMCLYSEGTIFALLHSDGQIYIKGVGAFIDVLEDMGLTRWTYQRENSDKVTAMPYWKMPEDALDNPDDAAALARRALEHLR